MRSTVYRVIGFVAFGSVLATGCQGAKSSGLASNGPQAPTAPQHILRIVANDLPKDLSAKPLANAAASGVAAPDSTAVFNSTLTYIDERGHASGYLAESLPQLDTSNWRLLPDGTMETTYRLKPNLTWHDGSPLTADDFVFAYQVYTTPDYGVNRSIPIRYMAGVEAPDPQMVFVRWSQSYTNAGRLDNDFPPLPAHLLGREQSGEKFLPNSSFWTTHYVGAGPYRLASFDPGVAIEGTAFDAYALGRPKIDRISLRAIPDTNAALAAVLAGEMDYGLNLFRAEEGLVLERDWVSTGAGVLLWEPLGSRTLNFQFRPEFAQPPEVDTDVRVRQAIAYAIDKQESFDVVTGGHGLPSNTRTHPGEEYQPLVEREVTKYTHDPRRAAQLLQDAGFTRAAGEQWQRPGGGPMELPISYTGGSKLFEHENLIIVDQLRRFGIDASSRLFPSSGTAQDRSQLLGMDSVGSADPTQYRTVNTPTAENRWAGANRGAYANPELDRLADALDKAIAPSEIVQLTIQLEKVTSSDLPGIFLYYHSRAWNRVSNLSGPTVRQALSAGHPLRSTSGSGPASGSLLMIVAMGATLARSPSPAAAGEGGVRAASSRPDSA